MENLEKNVNNEQLIKVFGNLLDTCVPLTFRVQESFEEDGVTRKKDKNGEEYRTIFGIQKVVRKNDSLDAILNGWDNIQYRRFTKRISEKVFNSKNELIVALSTVGRLHSLKSNDELVTLGDKANDYSLTKVVKLITTEVPYEGREPRKITVNEVENYIVNENRELLYEINNLHFVKDSIEDTIIKTKIIPVSEYEMVTEDEVI